MLTVLNQDVVEYAGCKMEKLPYPIIADEKRELAVQLGMIDPDERTKEGLPLAARAVFIIGPDKRMKLSIHYPATTGRNFKWVHISSYLSTTLTESLCIFLPFLSSHCCISLLLFVTN